MFTKTPKPNPDEILANSLCQIFRRKVEILDSYIRVYFKANSGSSSQIVIAKPYPIYGAGISESSYEALNDNYYANLVPYLEKLAKKYTVEVYQKAQQLDHEIACRINVYPSEQREYYQAHRNDVTWLAKEASADTLKEALEMAAALIEAILQES